MIAAIEAVCNEGWLSLGGACSIFFATVQTVTAVPEPSTGAMLRFGFAGGGLMAYFRHESKAPASMAV